MTPFQQILGAAFDNLPVPVRALHSLSSSAHTSGRAEVTATANPAAWMLRRVAGLPGPGTNVLSAYLFILAHMAPSIGFATLPDVAMPARWLQAGVAMKGC
jgi:hypothetical protein